MGWVGWFAGIVMVALGVILLLYKSVMAGVHGLTQIPSAHGGVSFILLGLLFLYISYVSLSPYSRIRKFLEGWKGKR